MQVVQGWLKTEKMAVAKGLSLLDQHPPLRA